MHLHLQIKDNGFFLLDQSNLVASFTYNTASSSFRLNAWSKRLFFLEEKGFLRKKVVLKTEYGVEIGECHFIRNGRNGIIYLNDRKFVFNGDNSEIRITDKQNNLVHCKLQQEVADLQWPALLFSLSLIYTHAVAEKQGSQMAAR